MDSLNQQDHHEAILLVSRTLLFGFYRVMIATCYGLTARELYWMESQCPVRFLSVELATSEAVTCAQGVPLCLSFFREPHL